MLLPLQTEPASGAGKNTFSGLVTVAEREARHGRRGAVAERGHTHPAQVGRGGFAVPGAEELGQEVGRRRDMRRSPHLCCRQTVTTAAICSSGRSPCCIANRPAIARLEASIFT